MISMLTNALVMASMLSPSPLTWNFEVTGGFPGVERREMAASSCRFWSGATGEAGAASPNYGILIPRSRI